MQIRFAALLALASSFVAGPAVARAVAQDSPTRDTTAAVLAAPGAEPLAFDSVQVGMLARMDASGLITRARAARVQSRFGDTLIVRGVKNRELLRIPPDRLEWMQVSTGRGWTRSGVTKGALIGVAAGFVVASIVQQFSESHKTLGRAGCPFTLSRECGRSRRLYLGAIALGAVSGAGFAVEAGDERWRLVRLPGR